MTIDLEKKRKYLFSFCEYFLNYDKPQRPADIFLQLEKYCRDNNVEADRYGTGKIIEEFENEIAEFLGFESGVFMPSGTMAQQIAMKVWCEQAKFNRFGIHHTSHLEKHEEKGYSELHNLNAVILGDPLSILSTKDIKNCKQGLAAVIIELPCRELGGALPSWNELNSIKKISTEKSIRIHIDGARLWECQPYYKQTYKDICKGFDSIYVSFYKGLGALSGSMLLGSSSFINEARIWQHRHGGRLFQLFPNVISAKLGFQNRINQFQQKYERTIEIANLLNNIEDIEVTPFPPQTNIIHVYIKRNIDKLLDARDKLAEKEKVWLFTFLQTSEIPNWCKTEINISDGALRCDNCKISIWFHHLLEDAR